LIKLRRGIKTALLMICGVSLLFCGTGYAAKWVVYPTSDVSIDADWDAKSGGDYYVEVDELIGYDNWTSYISMYGAADIGDATFGIPAPSDHGDGAINYVKVSHRCSEVLQSVSASITAMVVSNSTTEYGTPITMGLNWWILNEQFNTDPSTGEAWTWDVFDNNNVEMGVKGDSNSGFLACTGVWFEVDYDEPEGEALRPSADTATIENWSTDEATSIHYTEMDEAQLDSNDYVFQEPQTTNYKTDIYELTDATDSGVIDQVCVIGVIESWRFTDSGAGYFKLLLEIDGTEYLSEEMFPEGIYSGSWKNYVRCWDTNPATGKKWSWYDMDKLNVGVDLKCLWTSASYGLRAHQLWVVVDSSGRKMLIQ